MEFLSRDRSLASAGNAMINRGAFSKIVEISFSGLITRYGFKMAEATEAHARLDSPAVSVDLNYDLRQSHEVGVELFVLKDGKRCPAIPYSLGEVFRNCLVPDADKLSFFQSGNEGDVAAFLTEAAGLLDQYCEPCLRGAPEAFESLANQRSIEAARYTGKMRIASVRGRADEAWRRKDYQGVVDCFAELSDSLSEPDQKKLAYAMKHCGLGS